VFVRLNQFNALIAFVLLLVFSAGSTSGMLRSGPESAPGKSGSGAEKVHYGNFSGSQYHVWIFASQVVGLQWEKSSCGYETALGRFFFHTMDTYEGVRGDPITLHKYLYAHGNPISFIDPSGNFTIYEALGVLFIVGALELVAIQSISSALGELAVVAIGNSDGVTFSNPSSFEKATQEFSDFVTYTYLASLASITASQLSVLGYNVIVDTHATVSDLETYLSFGNLKAFVFFGHGGSGEMICPAGDSIRPSTANFLTRDAHLDIVVLHSCNSNAFADSFNTDWFFGWSRNIRYDALAPVVSGQHLPH